MTAPEASHVCGVQSDSILESEGMDSPIQLLTSFSLISQGRPVDSLIPDRWGQSQSSQVRGVSLNEVSLTSYTSRGALWPYLPTPQEWRPAWMCVAYRRTFKAGMVGTPVSLSGCRRGKAGEGSAPRARSRKSCLLPHPHLCPPRSRPVFPSQRPVAAPSPPGMEYQFVSLS